MQAIQRSASNWSLDGEYRVGIVPSTSQFHYPWIERFTSQPLVGPIRYQRTARSTHSDTILIFKEPLIQSSNRDRMTIQYFRLVLKLPYL